MKATILTFRDYQARWQQMANTTHQYWWQNFINSGQTMTDYLRACYRKYRNRYE